MNKESYKSIEGNFVFTIFKSDSFMVSRFKTNEDEIIVTGPSFEYLKTDKYQLFGDYNDHPKYGFQFNYIAIERCLPNKRDDIIKFLSSNIFKGIGKKVATRIYECFGDDCLLKIKQDPSIIDELKLTNKQILSIKEGLEKLNDEINEIILLLISTGFSNNEARRIYYFYLDKTLAVLNDNPYHFYLDLPNMSFIKVHNCVKNLDFENKEIKFKEAYLIYLFKEISFLKGDTYLNYEDFSNNYLKNYSDLDEIINYCLQDNQLILNDDKYYYFQEYDDEKTIANYLKKHNDHYDVDTNRINEALKDNEYEFNIEYDLDQKEAIISFFENQFSIIIGGPGSGKTTIIRTLVSLFKLFYQYNNIIVVAPTGRAAKRINEMCDVESKTIHSLLKWNKDTNTFIHNEENPVLYDCLIIDEFSMVDNNLFSSLLKACQYVNKICIIGDINQLPSIRQGLLLKDLIDSHLFKTTYLSYNHRQKEGNDIINLSRDIVNNEIKLNEYNNDIEFIDINQFNLNKLIEMIQNNINDGIDLDDIQILSPMYVGEYGIDHLNNYLQEIFNPKEKNKKEKKFGKYIFREKDKILQLKNRPMDDVYNGDIGILEEIDEIDKCFLIDYSGTKVLYDNKDLEEISLAYALSVHKAQGSEYKIVYYFCSKAHTRMQYKQLIYTAVSRAKNKLIIIGDIDVFVSGIKKELNKRKTTLLDFLND